MKSICLIIRSLNALGGVERETLNYIETLKEQGYKVVLATMEKTDWREIEKVFGKVDHKPDEERTLLLLKSGKFEIYQRLAASLLFNKFKDDIDITFNNHADIIPIKSDVAHVQDPALAETWSATTSFRRYRDDLFKIIYFSTYMYLHSRLVKKSLMESRILISDSTYAKESLRKLIGRESRIIHPPVDVQKYLCENHNEKREDIVISCARFSPEKNQRVIPLIASKVPDAYFYITGSIPTTGLFKKACLQVLEQLREDIREKDLSNVKILYNLSSDEQRKIYKKAKVFLHTAQNEHFGMAVVEGMAAGLAPVVYKGGGPWTDILAYGRYGFGYAGIDEAVEKIRRIISDESTYREASSLAMRRAKDFSKESFKREFLKVINSL